MLNVFVGIEKHFIIIAMKIQIVLCEVRQGRLNIYNRYCRFLAWEEHIRIASIYETDLVPVCTRKALLAAIKALLLYYGIGCKDSRVDFTSVRFYKKASR